MNRKCKGKCNERKPLSEFYRRIVGNDTTCIDCRIVEEIHKDCRLQKKVRLRRKIESMRKGLRYGQS
jgi:hypothetical protein